MRPRLLDLCTKQGGAAYGYWLAGFDVVGVDIDPQPHYPVRDDIEFVQADALDYLTDHGHEFAVITGSPPCQAHTLAQRIQGREHPDLIDPMRALMRALGIPYVIENVPGAPLIDPIEVCGASFPRLRAYRHRLFEFGGGIRLVAPPHPLHLWPTTKMGRPPRDGEFMHVVGNFSGAQLVREAWEVPWMTRDGMREAIPPAYTEFLGRQVLAQVALGVAA